ncbi:hypothetical protein BN137_2005 [Cronobacter condimenti 1330]|nr:hypothetical protein BN137_2005 [Cronobacter condimenti 1330]
MLCPTVPEKYDSYPQAFENGMKIPVKPGRCRALSGLAAFINGTAQKKIKGHAAL